VIIFALSLQIVYLLFINNVLIDVKLSLIAHILNHFDFTAYSYFYLNLLLLGLGLILSMTIMNTLLSFNLKQEAAKLSTIPNHSNRFLHQFHRILTQFPYYFRKMDYIDRSLVRWLLGSFLAILSFCNIFALSIVLQQGLTPVSIFCGIVAIGITVFTVMVSFEILIDVSQSLSRFKPQLMRFLASGRARNRFLPLHCLIRFGNFFEIIHNKRPFTFHIGFSRLSRKNCLFYLLFCFTSGLLFVAQNFEI